MIDGVRCHLCVRLGDFQHSRIAFDNLCVACLLSNRVCGLVVEFDCCACVVCVCVRQSVCVLGAGGGGLHLRAWYECVCVCV